MLVLRWAAMVLWKAELDSCGTTKGDISRLKDTALNWDMLGVQSKNIKHSKLLTLVVQDYFRASTMNKHRTRQVQCTPCPLSTDVNCSTNADLTEHNINH